MPQPLPQGLVRCTIGGNIYAGAEIWSTGFWLGHEDNVAEDPTQVAVDEIRGFWDTMFATTSFSSDYSTTSVKLSLYSALGNVVDDKTVFATIQNPAVGTANVGKQPPQIALVATLRSNKARGKTSHGRMFLPGPAATLDSTGHIPTATRDSLADKLKVFFDAIKASANIPWDPVLVSRGLAPGEGDVLNVVRVELGNVFDTQRKRRNSLVESYANRVLA